MIATIAAMLLAMDQKPAEAPASPGPPPIRTAPPAPPPPPSPYYPSPPGRAASGSRARPIVNLGRLIALDDYPAAALRANEEGTVGFRLLVGQTGRVVTCTITQSSGSASLDSATCRLLTARARFTPARDAGGNPTVDQYSARLVWRIEEEPLLPVAPALIVTRLSATPEGEISCAGTQNGEEMRLAPCPFEMVARIRDHARLAGRRTERTIVLTLTPAGSTEPADGADHGLKLGETGALLTVASDGKVTACIPPLLTTPANGGDPIVPDPCEYFPVGSPRFEAAPGPGPERSVRFRLRTYRPA